MAPTVAGTETGVDTREDSVGATVVETGVGVGFGATETPTAVVIEFGIGLDDDSSAWTGLLMAVPGNRNVKELAASCAGFVPEPSADVCGKAVVDPDGVTGTFSLILPGVFAYLGRECGGGRSDMSWRKWSYGDYKSGEIPISKEQTRRVLASSHIWL